MSYRNAKANLGVMPGGGAVTAMQLNSVMQRPESRSLMTMQNHDNSLTNKRSQVIASNAYTGALR